MSDQPQQPTTPEPSPPPPPPNPYGAAPQGNPYAPAPPSPYGATPPPSPSGAAAPPNPYGGYAPAPAYAGAPPVLPGNKAYVEQHFGPVADFGSRALALLIDAALSLVALVPIIIGAVLLATSAGDVTGYDALGYPEYDGADAGQAAAGGVVLGLGVLLAIGIQLWNRVFRMGRRGQSVGKSVIGLKLVDTRSGQPIGAGKAFLREVVHGLVNQVVYLSYLWMLWDADQQTVGDKAVGSTVIRVAKG